MGKITPADESDRDKLYVLWEYLGRTYGYGREAHEAMMETIRTQSERISDLEDELERAGVQRDVVQKKVRELNRVIVPDYIIKDECSPSTT